MDRIQKAEQFGELMGKSAARGGGSPLSAEGILKFMIPPLAYSALGGTGAALMNKISPPKVDEKKLEEAKRRRLLTAINLGAVLGTVQSARDVL